MVGIESEYARPYLQVFSDQDRDRETVLFDIAYDLVDQLDRIDSFDRCV